MGQSNSIHEEEHYPSSSEEEAFQRRQSAHIALNNPASIGLEYPDLRQTYQQTRSNNYLVDVSLKIIKVIWENIRHFVLNRASWLRRHLIRAVQKTFSNRTIFPSHQSCRSNFEMVEISNEPNEGLTIDLNNLSVNENQLKATTRLLKSQDSESKFALKDFAGISLKAYLDFAYLVDDNTINWIKSNHVMFVLRGLPGSGKTTLAKALKNVYAYHALGDFIFCSADTYFMCEGSYKFDASKLKFAHEECQNQMREAAICRLQTIVVDNTNIRHFEMKPYFQIANSEGYIVLIVEPKTPWRYNPEILSKRNNHAVSLELLQKKLKMYQPVIPLYYGWFLSVLDSRNLITMSKDILKMCLMTCEKFSADFKDFSLICNTDLQVDYYETPNRKCFSQKTSRLHCTAKYCGKINEQNKDELINYASRDAVNESIGQLSTLEIIGFVISKFTFGARLLLSDTQLMLYDQQENLKNAERSPANVGSSFEYVGAEENKNLENIYHIEKTTNFYPVQGKGKKAHITIGTACGVKPNQTGNDLLEAIEYEKCSSIEKLYYNIFTYRIPETSFVLRRYRKDLWVLYQSSKTYKFNALFTGYYV